MTNTEATLPSEWDAMKLVHDAIQHLDIDEKVRVLNWAFDKFQLQQKGNIPRPLSPSSFQVAGPDIPVDIKDFVMSKDPQGEVQRVICLGYYLEKYVNQKNFTYKEIEDANTQAKAFKFSNVSVPIKNATRSGYLNMTKDTESGRSTARELSSLGERIVSALPDQKAVQQIIQSFGKRRISRKPKLSISE